MQKTAKVTIEFTRKQLEHSMKRYRISLTDVAWDQLSKENVIMSLPYAEQQTAQYSNKIDGATIALAALDKVIEDLHVQEEPESEQSAKLYKVTGNHIKEIDINLTGDESVDDILEKVQKAILKDIKQ